MTTRRVILAYGRHGLPLDIPPHADVITSHQAPGLPDERAAILNALRNPINSAPLRDKVKPGQTVTIVHTDITRATPNALLLPIILQELKSAGIRRADITLINALGTHRPQTDPELRAMLGDHVVENYRCLQHKIGRAHV